MEYAYKWFLSFRSLSCFVLAWDCFLFSRKQEKISTIVVLYVVVFVRRIAIKIKIHSSIIFNIAIFDTAETKIQHRNRIGGCENQGRDRTRLALETRSLDMWCQGLIQILAANKSFKCTLYNLAVGSAITGKGFLSNIFD